MRWQSVNSGGPCTLFDLVRSSTGRGDGGNGEHVGQGARGSGDKLGGIGDSRLAVRCLRIWAFLVEYTPFARRRPCCPAGQHGNRGRYLPPGVVVNTNRGSESPRLRSGALDGAGRVCRPGHSKGRCVWTVWSAALGRHGAGRSWICSRGQGNVVRSRCASPLDDCDNGRALRGKCSVSVRRAPRGAARASFILAVSLGIGFAHATATAPSPTPARGGRSIAIEPELLRPYVDVEAARLLETVTANPGQLETRRSLASHYRAATRCDRVAEFFELTVQFVAAGTEDVSKTAETTPSLDCQVRATGSLETLMELDQRVAAAQPHVAAEVQNDQSRTGAGLAAAEAAIRTHGAFCPLLAEWASAYLWQTAIHPDQVDPVRRELAIRLLISLTDIHEYPMGSEGPASVYYVISQMLRRRADYVGAYVAALLAHDRLRRGSLKGSIEKSSFAAMLAVCLTDLRLAAREQRRTGIEVQGQDR